MTNPNKVIQTVSFIGQQNSIGDSFEKKKNIQCSTINYTFSLHKNKVLFSTSTNPELRQSKPVVLESTTASSPTHPCYCPP